MNGKRLTLCLALLGLMLLQVCVAQEPEEAQPEEQLATHQPEPVPTSAAEPDDPPAVVATPEPTELAPESVPESSADSIAAPEAAVEAMPGHTAAPQADAEAVPQAEANPPPQAEAEAVPQVEATPEPAPASEATSAPEFIGEPPFVPSSDEAESTQPDYQNDDATSHVNETPKMPETEEPAALPEETHNPKEPETPSQTPAKENTPALSCFSCTSAQKGACSSNPREKITCAKSSKGCFTLIKRDTKLITRGCQSELTDEGAIYCHKEPKLCEMCPDMLCNKQVVPPIAAATRISLGWTMFCLVSGLLLLV